MANDKIAKIEKLYAQSDLPEQPDEIEVNKVLVKMRERLIKKHL
jgi:hypothetical protein